MSEQDASRKMTAAKRGGLLGATLGLVVAVLLGIFVVAPLQAGVARSSDQLYLQTWGRPTVAPIIQRGTYFGSDPYIFPVRDVSIKYGGSVIHRFMDRQDSLMTSTNVWRSNTGELWVVGDAANYYIGDRNPTMPEGTGYFEFFAIVVLLLLFLASWAIGYDTGYMRDKAERIRLKQAADQADEESWNTSFYNPNGRFAASHDRLDEAEEAIKIMHGSPGVQD